MAQIQQLQLGDLMNQAAGYKNAQLQQRRAKGQLDDEQLRRTGTYAKIMMNTLGDVEGAAPEEVQARWQQGLSDLKSLGADLQGIPEQLTPEAYRFVDTLDDAFNREGRKYGLSLSRAVDDQGNPVYLRTTSDGAVEPVEGFSPPSRTQKVKINGREMIYDSATSRLIDPADQYGPRGPGGNRQPGGQSVDLRRQIAEEEAETAQELKASEERGKQQTQSLDSYIERGMESVEQMPSLYKAISLLDDVQTGGLTNEARLRAKQAFGVESADEGELSGLLGKAVLGQLRETFGAQFTENEGKKLERIEASFGKNPQTNRRLLQNALEMQQRIATRGLRAAEREGRDFDAEEIQRMMDESAKILEERQREPETITLPNGIEVRKVQ